MQQDLHDENGSLQGNEVVLFIYLFTQFLNYFIVV